MFSLPYAVLRRVRGASAFILVLLAIEFLDEFVFGGREAAWPLIRDELNLSYEQIGLLMAVPGIFAAFIEPVLGILADTWRRRILIIGGGIVFTVSAALTAVSGSFALLMIAFMAFAPASGAFVSLSQSALMDAEPTRHEQNMARWTFAGSLGLVVGSLLISALSSSGQSWRILFMITAVVAGMLVLFAARFPFPTPQPNGEADESDEAETSPLTFRQGVINAVRALRRPNVVRWLVLLEFADLMMDVLLAYLALYFVDVAGLSEADAALGITIWIVVGLLGDFLLIPLLERVRGLTYLRFSALMNLILYPAFLLVPDVGIKFAVVGLLGLLNAGWYAILQGQFYSAMPGQSGTVLALGNIFGLVRQALPVLLGVIAGAAGLDVAMWVLLAGPIALLIGIPRKDREAGSAQEA